jgi:predicted helicase
MARLRPGRARPSLDLDAALRPAIEGDPVLSPVLGLVADLSRDPTVARCVNGLADAMARMPSDSDPDVDAASPTARGDGYEQFLAAFDGGRRRALGVYFTPRPLAEYQARMAERLLAQDLGAPQGFLDERVRVLDPAAGSGNQLLAVLRRAGAREGTGPAGMASLAARTRGFELQAGAALVARARLAALLSTWGVAAVPEVAMRDALLPEVNVPEVTASEEDDPTPDRGRAGERAVIDVVLGNPPYGRTRLRDERDAAGRWSWIWSLTGDFKAGVPASERVNLKSLADPYVLFYRWAIWRLLRPGAPGRGLVSFVSNRSFLEGGAFAGMRATMREAFDRIRILDLGGDARAGRLAGGAEDENVFDIETPVAVTVCVRSAAKARANGAGAKPCRVEYLRLRGTGAAKLAALEQLDERHFAHLPGADGDPWVPAPGGEFFGWPSLAELFAASFGGLQTKRNHLVVAVRPEELARNVDRLRRLPASAARRLFHETRDRRLPSREELRLDPAAIARYGFRPLDRRWIHLHRRWVEYGRWESLQPCWGRENLALVTLSHKHGSGPAAFAQGLLPDLDAFRGSYSGRVFPLWDRRLGPLAPNVRRELLERSRAAYGRADPEEVFAYVYAVLQAPSYAPRFHEQLRRGLPRVPFPRSVERFRALAERGQRLLALHRLDGSSARSAGPARLVGRGTRLCRLEWDEARARVRLGPALFLEGVPELVWRFEVSGYPVLRRWLEGRFGLTLREDERAELLAVADAIAGTVAEGEWLDRELAAVLAGPKLDLGQLAAAAAVRAAGEGDGPAQDQAPSLE